MNFTSWLSGLNRRVTSRKRVNPNAGTPRVGVENMESRQLLSISALFIQETGELNIQLDSDDNVRVGSSATGNVQIEVGIGSGAYVSSDVLGVRPAVDVRSIVILGGDNQNVINLNGVTSAVFKNLQAIEVDGANGNDSIVGSFDIADSLSGGNGEDTITGQGGNDTLIGGDGDDVISAGLGDDSIRSGDGNDAVTSDAGNDVVDAGNGDDTVSTGDGNDSVFAGNGQDLLTGGTGDDTLNGDGGSDTIFGNDGNDLLFGGEFGDSIEGGAGNDTLVGNAGNDTLIGVTGQDQIDGGAGNDVIKSALDIPTDDAIPAAAQPAPSALTPSPLPDAVDSTLGTDTTLTSFSIGTGVADGGLTVLLTGTGSFGNGTLPTSTNPGAKYNPIDPAGTTTPVGVGNTVTTSDVYFRNSTTSGARNSLESLAVNRSNIFATTTEANSSFDVGSLHFALTQLVEPSYDLVTGVQIGSLLTQTYHVTNLGNTTANFELDRVLDGDMTFDTSTTEGGGRVVSVAGDEFLVETDRGGTSAATNFVGITAKGGTIPKTNRFEINQSATLLPGIQSGALPSGTIFNDTNGDQSIDTDYDVAMSLRNLFSLAPAENTVYTTHTLFATGTPNQVQLNQKPVTAADEGSVLEGREIAVDVVSNDSDTDGRLDYASIQIYQQPVHGTTAPLADGRIRYTPNAGYSGDDFYFYTIADNLGARSNPTRVAITVNAIDVLGDAINAGAGDDTVIGGDGNDTIQGGAGQDSILGGVGNDRIQGQSGDDTIIGGGGADVLDGGAGNDLLRSTAPIDLPLPRASINPTLLVSEGNVGNSNVIVTVTLQTAFPVPVTVDFATQNGTATAGVDYVANSGTVTFAPGVTSQSISVPVIGDTVLDGTNDFSIILSNPVNATIAQGTSLITIVDDDVPTSQFDIQVVFSGGLTPSQQAVFKSAELRWEQIIVGDVLDVNVPGVGLVDDLIIDASGVAIDGVNGILGQAGPTFLRPTSFLPATGTMQFDTADLAALEASGQLNDVILHEMGHVLGFGTIWQSLGLLVNPSAAGGSDPRFNGPMATAEYNTRFGTSDTGVPVEATGGPGTADGHWRETVFNNELMTGFIDPGFNPISRVTIAQFADLGYQVVLTQANPFLRAAPKSVAVQTNSMFDRILTSSSLRTLSSVFGVLIDVPDTQGDLILGGDGNDTLEGAAGNDTLNGQGGNDSLLGGDNNDLLFGGAGQDTLDGQAGNDTLNGQGGSDTLLGGDNDDTFVLDSNGAGTDSVDGQTGFNTIEFKGTTKVDVVTIGQVGSVLTIDNGFGTISATLNVQNVVVNMLAGNDKVAVGDINKVSGLQINVNGGDGNDLLSASGAQIGSVRLALNGGDGLDTLNGSLGNDSLNGGTGKDLLAGNAGNDTIQGGDDNDTINGGLGDDVVSGGDGSDSISGQEGDDNLNGGNGNDTITGELGNDTLSGGSGDDYLNGMEGDDSILGGVGQDAISGGIGNDTLDGGRNDDSINGNAGNDLIRGDHGNDLIDAGGGNNTVNGGDGDDTIMAFGGNDYVHGGDGNDRINVGSGDDIVAGGDGDDTVLGGAGNDIILGGDGADWLDGQGGTDTVAGQQGADFINDPTAEINEKFVLPANILKILTGL